MLPGFFVFNFLSLMNNSYAGGKCVALGVGHCQQLQGCGHIDADAVATAASLGVTVEGCTDLIADVAGCDDSNYGDLIQGLCPGPAASARTAQAARVAMLGNSIT